MVARGGAQPRMVCHGGWNSEGQRTGLLNIPTCNLPTFQPVSSPSSQVHHICYSGRPKRNRQPSTSAAEHHTKQETHAVSHATFREHAVNSVHNFNTTPVPLPLPPLAPIHNNPLTSPS